MLYGYFKDFPRKVAADKVLGDKSFNIAKNSKCDGYQSGLASIVYKFFNKLSSGRGVLVKLSQTINWITKAGELQKPIIRKFEKRIEYSFFKDNIWGADLANLH